MLMAMLLLPGLVSSPEADQVQCGSQDRDSIEPDASLGRGHGLDQLRDSQDHGARLASLQDI